MFKFGKPKLNQIKIQQQFLQEGIQYQIIRISPKGKQWVCSFPLENVSIIELKQSGVLSFIEGLELAYSEENIRWDEKQKTFFLPYPKIYQLEDFVLTKLGLPHVQTEVDVQLEGTSAVGLKDFEIHARVYSKEYGHLSRFAKRHGPFYELPNGRLILLSRPVYDLLHLLDSKPGAVEDQFEYVARVKLLAQKAGAGMNEALEKEEFILIDEDDIEIEVVSPAELSITPVYKSSHSLAQNYADQIHQMARNAERYEVDSSTGLRIRMIAPKEAQERAKKILNTPRITGLDVPRFIENPAAFFQEELFPDSFLEQFSDRVKGLGIRVYQSRPYIHMEKKDSGLFQFDFGFRLDAVSESDDDEAKKISFQEQAWIDLIQEATTNGQEYVYHEEIGWIKVAPQGDQFIQKVKQLQDGNRESSFDPTRLPYVLEIFSNIDVLEYNQVLLDEIEKLKKERILDDPPSFFRANLYDYQNEGFRWLKRIKSLGLGGLLADEMGLGKTVQVIAFLASLKERDELKPSIVLAPKSLLENWVKEIRRFCPSMQIVRHHGSGRIKKKELLENFELVLCSYETLIRDQLLLGQIDWNAVICDEAQKFKNPTTLISSSVKALKNRVRVALTGTPVENGLSDLWSILDFVQPGLLGSLAEFRKEFERPLMSGPNQEIAPVEQRLVHRIQPVYLRRTKTEHLSGQLPEKIELPPVEIPMSPLQETLYASVVRKVQQKEMHPLEALSRLKQICSHPGLYNRAYEDIHWEKLPKLKKTLEFLARIREKGEKALIFTEYLLMQSILQRTIAEVFDISLPMLINGSVSGRQHIVDRFNTKEGFDVLILSPRAAGVGLNIAGANHVIHYTRTWNPAVEKQATDRAYRIGQTKDVYVYYPVVVSEHGKTLEVHVDQLLSEKRHLAEYIIIPSSQLEIDKELQRLIFQ